MYSDVNRERAALPRGRHKLPRHVVRASQRERLLAAMLDSVAERGFEATTVPAVVRAARVSPNAFYELFSDKTECFLALCSERVTELLSVIARPESDDWRVALRSGAARYLAWWAEHPAFSRAYFAELPAAGVRALEHRDGEYARFRRMFDDLAAWARASDPHLPPLAPRATQCLAPAVTELVAEEVRAGRTAELPALEDDVVWLCTLLLCGGV